MSSKSKTLDQGELPGGLSWEAVGISPACGCTITASLAGINRTGFSTHPLLLHSPSKRQQMAAELMLPAIALAITGDTATGPDAAAAAIEGATAGELLEQGQLLVTAWKQARNQCRTEQNQRAEDRRRMPVANTATV